MKVVNYYVFTKNMCEEVINLWLNTEGIRLHENGEDTIEGINDFLARNPGFSFVAKYNDKIIGALLCGHDGRRGCIHHLAVDRQLRGMNIGKTLLQMSLEQLKKAKIRKCILFVLKDNDRAESFYKHLNWQEENIVKIYSTIL